MGDGGSSGSGSGGGDDDGGGSIRLDGGSGGGGAHERWHGTGTTVSIHTGTPTVVLLVRPTGAS